MKVIINILVIILCTKFYGALPAPINLLTLAVALVYSLNVFKKKALFKKGITLLFIGIIINAISAKYFRDQDMLQTLSATGNVFYILLYFFFLKIDCSLKDCEKIILILGYVFCFCYIIQYIVYPFPLFDGATFSYTEDVRIRLTGQAILFLSYFYALNKFLIKPNIKYAVLIILSGIVVLLMGFRVMLFLLFILSLFLIYKINGLTLRSLLYIFLAGICVFILLQIPEFQDKVLAILERQEKDNFDNEDYVRILNINYYLNEHFHSGWEMFFGSGTPNDSSEYGIYMKNIAKNDGYIYEDIGLWGLSWVMGIIPIFAMLLYSIKAIRLKKMIEYKYLSLFFLFLILSSILSSEFFRTGNFVIQAFALYIIDKHTNEIKNINGTDN
ncbi:hypothetical protein [Dysgonomonas sp. Marseille-P4361]|uniref:hypothetical protein n=1 Tax=Dysgonomonas sp. Marseille-P4361 TaxID=2161820 RepID=UPI000D553DCF|nr:hypothetical protein [Dysgonomonas sp. Marseille-P4361]